MPTPRARDRDTPRLTAVAWMVPLGVLLAAAAVLTAGIELRPVTLLLLWLACITPSLVRTDIATHRLPNRLVLPALAAAVPIVVVDALIRGEAFWVPIVAGLGVGGVLYLCAVFGGLGMGDVKLGALLGSAVGCFGPSAVECFAIATIGTAGLVGGFVVVLARRRGTAVGWRTRIPFGPFLLLGCWTAVVLTG